MIKKRCKKCGEKVNSKDKFCSNCGNPLKKIDNKDWGMLGKNDFEEQDSSVENIFSGFGGSIFNKMLGSAMKMLEKEIKKEMKNTKPKTNVRLMINGKEINLDGIKKEKEVTEKKEKIMETFSEEKRKKFSKLSKKEPSTNIRRLSDSIIYEINVPGVKSLKDISITKLENSIEIKAISKDKAYFKIINLNFPIMDYNLKKEKIILELEAKS